MKTRIMAVTILTVATSAAWFLFLFKPALDNENALTDSLNTATLRLNDISRIVLDTPEFYQKYKDLLTQKESAQSQLYSREDLIHLFADLENKARSHHLELAEITPSVEELLLLNRDFPGNGAPQILRLAVSLRGRFADAGDFIGEMEKEKFYQGLDFCHIVNNAPGNPLSDIRFSFRAVLGTIRDTI